MATTKQYLGLGGGAGFLCSTRGASGNDGGGEWVRTSYPCAGGRKKNRRGVLELGNGIENNPWFVATEIAACWFMYS